jgi:hypothetical protein
MSFQFSFLVCIICANPFSHFLFRIAEKCGSQQQCPSILPPSRPQPSSPRVLNGQVCYIASFVYITNHILHTFVYGPLISLFSIQFSTTRTTERSHPLHFAALWALDANSHFKNCPCTSTRMASKVTGKQPDKQLPCLSLTCPSELFLICAIHGLPWLAR